MCGTIWRLLGFLLWNQGAGYPGSVNCHLPPLLLRSSAPHASSIFAAGFEKYVKMIPAPARVIEVRLSIMARSWSIQPLRAAATIIEYSPLTW